MRTGPAAAILSALLLAGIVQAQDATRSVLATNGPSPAVVAEREIQAGIGFLAQNQVASAVEAFQRAALLQPDSAEAFGQWGHALVAAGKQARTGQQMVDHFREATEKYAKAVQLNPNEKTYHLRWADLLVLIGDLPVVPQIRLACYQGAVAKYQRAIELSPQEAEPYVILGTLFTHKLPQFAADDKAKAQLHHDAAVNLSKAIERSRFSSEVAPALVLYGTALAREGRYTTELAQKKKLLRQSADQFEKSARVLPNVASTYALWGTALLELGKLTRLRTDLREAASQLSTSVALKPGDPAVLYTLACAYAQINNVPMAVQTLRQCFEADPNATYRAAAKTEPDLAGLKGDTGFENLFAEKTAPTTVGPYNPPLRDR